jgi:uncharacterized membrane protein YjjP (DUF1212 family)
VQKIKLKFIARMAESLHNCGAASYHIENAMKSVAEKILFTGDFFATPTQINCAVEDVDGEVATRLIRVYPAGIDLTKLSHIDALVDEVTDGLYTEEEGLAKLEQIQAMKEPWWQKGMPLAFALCSGLFTSFFGARFIEMLMSGLFSLLIFFLMTLQEKLRLSATVEFVGAFLVSFSAHMMTLFFPDLMADKVILGSIIVLIPGLGITIALAELAIKHLTAGTTRLMGAFMELLKMSLGVFLGTKEL